MLFPVFAFLSFLVLRLGTRARLRTVIWLAIVLGLLADFGVDMLVTLRRR